ncbi:MAG: flagellar motor switch protein FliN [Proteobacteria bacterium]|uniref:Flagellar motor switch protein FliN n=2 Tax=Gammaproteobacteria TaxID=1236 RepID=A0A9D9GPE7_9GAMM|nr:flagellar motor switch protein FliN [Candidatus Avisuccinivibrio stercorigallinarum]
MSDNDNKLAEEWAAALGEQGAASAGGTGGAGSDVDFGEAAPASIEQFNENPTASKAPLTREERKKLDAIMDIPVTITMEVGHAKISIRNLLQLNQGSVIELERLAGEPLDVLVNGTLIAHGEVVVVNDKFGIRLTDVISQVERIKKLR